MRARKARRAGIEGFRNCGIEEFGNWRIRELRDLGNCENVDNLFEKPNA